MAKKEVSFSGPPKSGLEYYYGTKFRSRLRKAVDKFVKEEKDRHQTDLEFVSAHYDTQNAVARDKLGLKKSEAENLLNRDLTLKYLKKSNKIIAEKMAARRRFGFQEYPLVTKPHSCVIRIPSYDYGFEDVPEAGGAGVAEHVGSTIAGQLGGNCVYAYAGGGHVVAGTLIAVNVGEHRGDMTADVTFEANGRWALSAAPLAGWAHTRASVSCAIWGSSGEVPPWFDSLDYSSRTIYDHTVIAFGNGRRLNDERYLLRLTCSVEPHRWYVILACTNIWTSVGGLASGGSNMLINVPAFQVCAGC